MEVPGFGANCCTLFRYAISQQLLIIFCSSACAIAAGTVLPLITVCGASTAPITAALIHTEQVVFGNFAGTFTDFLSGAVLASSFNHNLRQFSLYFVYLGEFPSLVWLQLKLVRNQSNVSFVGVGSFASVFMSMRGFNYTGERMTQRIRENYLKAILRQNIGYFDNVGAGEITTRITADMTLIQVTCCFMSAWSPPTDYL